MQKNSIRMLLRKIFFNFMKIKIDIPFFKNDTQWENHFNLKKECVFIYNIVWVIYSKHITMLPKLSTNL